MSKVITSLCLLVSSLSVVSGQQIITDRPDQTESARVVPIGRLQIESGMSVETEGDQHSYTLNTSLFRYGITKRLEGRLQSDLLGAQTREGFTTGVGDIVVGIKYAILKGPIELAYLGQVSLPSGSSAFTADELNHSHRLSIARDLSSRLSLGINVGYTFSEISRDEVTYTLAAAYAMTNRLGFFSEIYGSIIQNQDNRYLYNHGFTYLVKETIQLDASFGTGFNTDAAFWSLGISVLMPR